MNLKVSGDSIEELYKDLVLEVKNASESVYVSLVRSGYIVDDSIDFSIKTIIDYKIEDGELEDGILGIESSLKEIYNKDDGELFPIRVSVDEVCISGITRDGRPIIRILYRFR